MDNYAVKLSPGAVRDLEQIYDYIAKHLLEPGTAEHMVNRLEQGILSLKRMPERNPTRQMGIYAGHSYRQLFVQKYVIVYRVFREKKEVHIMTVRYAPSQF